MIEQLVSSPLSGDHQGCAAGFIRLHVRDFRSLQSLIARVVVCVTGAVNTDIFRSIRYLQIRSQEESPKPVARQSARTYYLVGCSACTLTKQIDLSCAYVRVQPILAIRVVLPEDAEESACVRAIGLSVYLADANRCVYVPVIPLVSRRDRNLSSVEFDIFIPHYLVHLHLSSGHLNAQIHLARHFDTDLKVTVLEISARDREFGVGGSSRESETDMTGAVHIIGRAGDMYPLLVYPDYLDARRP